MAFSDLKIIALNNTMEKVFVLFKFFKLDVYAGPHGCADVCGTGCQVSVCLIPGKSKALV